MPQFSDVLVFWAFVVQAAHDHLRNLASSKVCFVGARCGHPKPLSSGGARAWDDELTKVGEWNKWYNFESKFKSLIFKSLTIFSKLMKKIKSDSSKIGTSFQLWKNGGGCGGLGRPFPGSRQWGKASTEGAHRANWAPGHRKIDVYIFLRLVVTVLTSDSCAVFSSKKWCLENFAPSRTEACAWLHWSAHKRDIVTWKHHHKKKRGEAWLGSLSCQNPNAGDSKDF